MSVMDMFRSIMPSAAPQQQQQAMPQPGNIPAGAGNADVNNPTVPQGQAQEPVVPLADFADLWKPNPVDPNKPTDNSILGNMDPAKVMEAARKTDFTKVISQDSMAKINAGGPEAMQAFVESMNNIAQTVYANSAIAASKMVEQATAKMQDRYAADLPAQIKRHAVQDNLRADNPIYTNPAVAPLISAMEQQFTVKYPNASATEITNLARQYVSGLGEVFSPQKAAEKAATEKAAAGTDWTSFLG